MIALITVSHFEKPHPWGLNVCRSTKLLSIWLGERGARRLGISPNPRRELKTSYMALDASLMTVLPPPSIALLDSSRELTE